MLRFLEAVCLSIALLGYSALTRANSNLPIDCNCLMALPGLTTNACYGIVPDFCASATNCFSTNLMPGSCSQTPAPNTFAGPGTNTIIVTALDTLGSPYVCSVDFVVIAPPPSLTLNVASNKTIGCGSYVLFDKPVVSNTCCANDWVDVWVASTVTNGVCPKVVTRTWQATNQCGNAATCSQTVTLLDTTPPGFQCDGVNLVPNGSFEVNSECPSSISQLDLAAPWFTPTDATPDYYHSCAGPVSFVSTPTNTVGVQTPSSGQAYAGAVLYSTNGTGTSNSYREYLEVPLIAPLMAGRKYQLSFRVSLADESAFAIANVGARFFATPLTWYGPSNNLYGGVLPVPPSIENPSTNMLASTNSWMVIQSMYTALGGERFLILGNFRTDPATTATNTGGATPYAYYYFDDVSLVAVCDGALTNKVVECGDTWIFDEPAAYDLCDQNVTVSVSSTVTNGLCPKVITRTWTLSDSCGNSTNTSQTVTIVDNQPPFVLCAGANLVPNGDFENFTNCPYFFSQLSFAAPWFNPSIATPDYLNACANPNPFISVPANVLGYQQAYNGQGYGGAILYSQAGGFDLAASYREYLEVPLLQPLQPGASYRVSFRVNLAEDSTWAIANIGAYLSAGAVTTNIGTGVFNYVPQVANPATNVITSTNAWTLIQGVFTAAGGETHLTLGNFLPDAATTAVPANGFYTNFAYYFFDDVVVERLCSPDTTNKIVTCGSPLVFDPPTGYDLCSGTNVTVSLLNTVTNQVCPLRVTRRWLLTDACGNTNSWAQTIVANDPTPPIVNCGCLQDSILNVLTTNACSAVIPNLSFLSNSPCVSETCGQVTVLQSPAAGTPVGAGTHSITVTFSNCSGLTTSCMLPFSVNAAAPVLVCPPTIYLTTCSNSAVGNYLVNVFGNVGPVASTPPSGTAFPIGTNTVTCIATNACGVSATCSFQVIVRRNSTKWACRAIAIGVPFTPIGTARSVVLPTLSDGTPAVLFDSLEASGDGARFYPGAADEFTFTTELPFDASDDARLDILSAPLGGGSPSERVISFERSSTTQNAWLIRKNRLFPSTTAEAWTSVAIGTNGQLFPSISHDSATQGDDPLAVLSPMNGATSALITVTFNLRTAEVILELPHTIWANGRKGWDGCIYGTRPRGTSARLIITPAVAPGPPAEAVDLVTHSLATLAFQSPTISVAGRKWGDGHVTLMKAYDDGEEQGIAFRSLGEGGGVRVDVGYSAEVRLRSFFETDSNSPQEQLYRFQGAVPAASSPAAATLRFSGSASGAGADCYADVAEWGATTVTLRMLLGTKLIAEATGVSAGPSSPVATFAELPTILRASPSGFVLSHTNPLVITSGLSCGTGACTGTELHIVPESGSTGHGPSALTDVACLVPDETDGLIYRFETTPACSASALRVSLANGVIQLTWDGEGYELQGAETVDGRWFDLGVTSPASIPASANLRAFRLRCR